MSPLTSSSPVHFVVLARQLLKSRSSGFPPGDRYPFPLHIPPTPLRLASDKAVEDANTSPLTCGQSQRPLISAQRVSSSEMLF